jgi:hypothetical protein
MVLQEILGPREEMDSQQIRVLLVLLGRLDGLVLLDLLGPLEMNLTRVLQELLALLV